MYYRLEALTLFAVVEERSPCILIPHSQLIDSFVHDDVLLSLELGHSKEHFFHTSTEIYTLRIAVMA